MDKFTLTFVVAFLYIQVKKNYLKIFLCWLIKCVRRLHYKVGTEGWTELELVRFDNIECSLWTSYLKFQRVNKTTYGITGQIQIFNDFSNDWKVYYGHG